MLFDVFVGIELKLLECKGILEGIFSSSYYTEEETESQRSKVTSPNLIATHVRVHACAFLIQVSNQVPAHL